MKTPKVGQLWLWESDDDYCVLLLVVAIHEHRFFDCYVYDGNDTHDHLAKGIIFDVLAAYDLLEDVP